MRTRYREMRKRERAFERHHPVWAFAYQFNGILAGMFVVIQTVVVPLYT